MLQADTETKTCAWKGLRCLSRIWQFLWGTMANEKSRGWEGQAKIGLPTEGPGQIQSGQERGELNRYLTGCPLSYRALRGLRLASQVTVTGLRPGRREGSLFCFWGQPTHDKHRLQAHWAEKGG